MKGGELYMKKFLVSFLVAAATFVMAVSVFAVPAGRTVEFDGKGAGKVVFDGKLHADKGLKCADCHQSGLFKMKKGADAITMKDSNDGKFCGSCHNGAKAFSVQVAANCAKCHTKK
jgi:c(7)-type cytochrome triheme protein